MPLLYNDARKNVQYVLNAIRCEIFPGQENGRLVANTFGAV